jgi:2-polyprenyl-3-methyl-5-hydroxy-6-metoxy-1,4-benzoquinol methylase
MRCLCGRDGAQELFVAGGNPVRRCSCGQVRVEISQPPDYSFDYFTSTHNYYERKEEFLALFDELLESIEAYETPGQLLDVGTGSGLLLVAARRRKWSVAGVEISPEAAARARDTNGLDVIAGDVFAVPDRAVYDVVIFNHVVEHLVDPIENLRYGVERLRPGGLLVIGVPNFGSWMAQLRKAHWASLHPQEHYWQFTHESLLRAIEPLGLRLVHFETTNYVLRRSLNPKEIVYKLQSPVSAALGRGEAMVLMLRKS